MSYVNQAPYIWGSVPGAAQDPRVTGWDCSGMTYWLDQKFGSGQLPAGSHYQYQWGLDNGKIFSDTSQLQPGDLVFFDTGNYSGGGANLNNAGHVAMYIGNGKVVHAANPSSGTIISDLAAYQGMYQYLGGMHMSWSGGGSGYGAGNIAGQPTQGGGGYSMNDQMYRAMMGLPY
ncbi:MAG TPA: NlpC/P60 family protein, partial [Gemmatimonadales bacterium]|nr:NlpC/P60 family protein [Gemmatimonadales bacterium]